MSIVAMAFLLLFFAAVVVTFSQFTRVLIFARGFTDGSRGGFAQLLQRVARFLLTVGKFLPSTDEREFLNGFH